jgi:ferric-dicitrate binding protein FerR (iron transport regulator)
MAARDDEIAALRRREPPWDELLERRVLNEVHAAHQRPENRRQRHASRWALAAGLVVAGSVGAWAVASYEPREPAGSMVVVATPSEAQPAAMEPPRLPSPAPTPPREDRDSVMSLADGSRVLLEDGARVESQVQTDTLVDLAHHEGRVRYEVAPAPDRIFVVHAGSYQVRVLGTVFVMETAGDRLRIEVERGTVEVSGADRVLELGAGDRIDLPRHVVPEPTPTAPTNDAPARGTTKARGPTASSLLAEADAARRSGRLDEAAEVLEQLVRDHARDPRTPSAWFMLGRVRRQLGRHAEAARAFRSAWKAGPSPALAEDARAEEAMSWRDAGSHEQAAKAAKSYLERYPEGTHVARIRAIVP